MKQHSKVIALAVVMAGTVLAQAPFGVMTASAPPDPAALVANQVARLTALLNLTTAQAAEATTIFTNAQTTIAPLQTTLSTDYTSMQTAVKSNATATINSLASDIGATTGKIAAAQNLADAAFYAILTTAQQTTLNSSGGYPGGPGPGPGFGGLGH